MSVNPKRTGFLSWIEGVARFDLFMYHAWNLLGGIVLRVASFLIFMMSSFLAFGSDERQCAEVFLSSGPLFEELVRLRRSIDDSSASDSERRARQRDYRVRMREAVKNLNVEAELLVSMIEARVREERGRPLVEVRSTEITDLAPRTVTELAEDAVIERLTLSGKRYLEFDDPTWKMRVWQDEETGLVWRDVFLDADGQMLGALHDEAQRICREIGGRLPTKEEYEKLRADFTKPGTDEYVPQLFMEGENGKHWFWSSSPCPERPSHAYHFSGSKGRFSGVSRSFAEWGVRCVRP